MRNRRWLLGYTDFAVGVMVVGAFLLATQTSASRAAGSDGWMLWNPRNVYTTNDIKPEPPESKAKAAR